MPSLFIRLHSAPVKHFPAQTNVGTAAPGCPLGLAPPAHEASSTLSSASMAAARENFSSYLFRDALAIASETDA